jgi:hypothetical protein
MFSISSVAGRDLITCPTITNASSLAVMLWLTLQKHYILEVFDYNVK